VRLAVTPSWHAGQACPGGAAGLGPPDAPGAGAILSSQHSGHSTCGRPCRPCPCSHTKYAAPATSSRLRPPPKGSPGALGMRRGIAVHLSLDKAARPGTIAAAGPFQGDTIRPIDGKACRRCPRPPSGRPASQRPDPAISHQGAGQRQSRYAIGPGHSSRAGSADLVGCLFGRRGHSRRTEGLICRCEEAGRGRSAWTAGPAPGAALAP